MVTIPSVTGVQLARWYLMGITDCEDLTWLLNFYTNDTWNTSQMASALTTALEYLGERG